MAESKKSRLPEQFVELDSYVDAWDNSGIAAQYAKRLASSVEELQGFHAALKPRVLEIREYLDGKRFEDFNEQDRRLGRLVFAWVPVAEAIEVFKQARVPDSKMYWEIVEEPHLF